MRQVAKDVDVLQMKREAGDEFHVRVAPRWVARCKEVFENGQVKARLYWWTSLMNEDLQSMQARESATEGEKVETDHLIKAVNVVCGKPFLNALK